MTSSVRLGRRRQRPPDPTPGRGFQVEIHGLDPYDPTTGVVRSDPTVSRPFPRPASGRIAVKVINHFGDEILKVYGV